MPPSEGSIVPGGPPREEAAVDKASLRRRLVAARALISDSTRTEAGHLIRDHVLGMPQVAAAGTIAAYYSVGSEPDTRGLVFALWKRGSYVILPVLLPDGDLDWASYEGPDSLAPGPRGLLQPVEPVRGVDTVARADVVLVPALAVDAAGNRLGRGGGSYDPRAGQGRRAGSGDRAALRRGAAPRGARHAARPAGPRGGAARARDHMAAASGISDPAGWLCLAVF